MNDTRPSAPTDARIYAIGDIHGRADLLDALMEQIAEDTKTRPLAGASARKVLVFLGDYVDRGDQSRDVIERLCDFPQIGFEDFEVHFLKGNHEDFLVQFLDTGDHSDSWLINGGRETLESYGIDAGLIYVGEALAELRKQFDDALPDSHLDFFRSLELSHLEGDYLFVHAGVRPGVAIDAQDALDLMWIRGDFLSSDADFGKVVVHGHTVQPEPQIHPNRIGIDTGAYYSERLTALVLEGSERRFLQT